MNKLIAIILIPLSTAIFAQDQVAKEILERLKTTTKAYKNITIEFDFIIKNKDQKIKKHEQGTLVLSDDKFQLIMNNKTIINNGETQWIYLADMNEVQIIEHDPKDQMISINRLLKIYEENAQYTYVGTESKKGKCLQIIDLLPKENQEFIKITLAIDTEKTQLQRITINHTNEEIYTYLIHSFKSNSIIQPFIFNITDFPDIEVIDLR